VRALKLTYFRKRGAKLETRTFRARDWVKADLVMGWLGFSRDLNATLL